MNAKLMTAGIIAGLALPLGVFLLANVNPPERRTCAAPVQGSEVASHGCLDDGQLRSKTMFGRRFLHLADVALQMRNQNEDTDTNKAIVYTLPILSFVVGDTVSILHTPGGDTFISVNSLTASSFDVVELPFGWTLESKQLTGPIAAELFKEARAG